MAMIFEHELRGAAFRDFVDVAHDRFNVRMSRFADVARWAILKSDADIGQQNVRCAMLPQNPPSLILLGYTASLALAVDGKREADQRVSTLKYKWHFLGEELHFSVGMINDCVKLINFEDEDRVETLLGGDMDMKAAFEKDLRAALG